MGSSKDRGPMKFVDIHSGDSINYYIDNVAQTGCGGGHFSNDHAALVPKCFKISPKKPLLDHVSIQR